MAEALELSGFSLLHGNVAARADLLSEDPPVPLQLTDFLPLVELVRVGVDLFHEGPLLRRRESADASLGMKLEVEEDFVFDDVSRSREDRLIHQRVADHGFRDLAHGFERFLRIPLRRHQIRRPVVKVFDVSIESANRAAVKVNRIAPESQFEFRDPVFSWIVDSVTAEHQEMDSESGVLEAQKEMFSPALGFGECAASKEPEGLHLGAAHGVDPVAEPGRQIFTCYDERRTFHRSDLNNSLSPLRLAAPRDQCRECGREKSRWAPG
jgi:hypothetical protein